MYIKVIFCEKVEITKKSVGGSEAFLPVFYSKFCEIIVRILLGTSSGWMF